MAGDKIKPLGAAAPIYLTGQEKSKYSWCHEKERQTTNQDCTVGNFSGLSGRTIFVPSLFNTTHRGECASQLMSSPDEVTRQLYDWYMHARFPDSSKLQGHNWKAVTSEIDLAVRV
jgi:hypothetical protein